MGTYRACASQLSRNWTNILYLVETLYLVDSALQCYMVYYSCVGIEAMHFCELNVLRLDDSFFSTWCHPLLLHLLPSSLAKWRERAPGQPGPSGRGLGRSDRRAGCTHISKVEDMPIQSDFLPK